MTRPTDALALAFRDLLIEIGFNIPDPTIPIDPPEGYRWHLDTWTSRWLRGGRESIGDLELIEDAVEVDHVGMLWIRKPIPGKKRKTTLHPTFATASATIHSPLSIRRTSRHILREHNREQAREAAIKADQTHLADVLERQQKGLS